MMTSTHIHDSEKTRTGVQETREERQRVGWWRIRTLKHMCFCIGQARAHKSVLLSKRERWSGFGQMYVPRLILDATGMQQTERASSGAMQVAAQVAVQVAV